MKRSSHCIISGVHNITGDVNLDDLGEVCLPGFSTVK